MRPPLRDGWRDAQVAYDAEFAKLMSPPKCKLESEDAFNIYFDQTARVQIGVEQETSCKLFEVVSASYGVNWLALDINSYQAYLAPRPDLYEVEFRNTANDSRATCYASVTEKPVLKREGIVAIYATTGDCAPDVTFVSFNLNADTKRDYVHFCYKKALPSELLLLVSNKSIEKTAPARIMNDFSELAGMDSANPYSFRIIQTKSGKSLWGDSGFG